MRVSIRYQLLVPLLTLLLGVVAISAWTAWASADRSRRQIEEHVRNVARTLGETSFPLTANVLEQMKGLSGAEYLVIEKNGHRLATLPVAPVDLPPPGEWQTLRLGRRAVTGDKAYLCSGVRLQQRPGSTLYLLYPETRWRDALWEAIYPSLLLGIFGGAASVALAVGVAQRLSRRVRELERRTRLIAAGDFSPMPLPGRDDELRDLGRSVNDMAQRLAQLEDAAKKTERLRLLGQVSGGLAHQLRNGVAGARLAVQLHARECNGQADAEALHVALRQLALVEANIKRFLDLGRSEGLCLEPCSLRALLEETMSLLRPRCGHAHIDLRWQAPAQDRQIEADAGQLRHLFLNVLGNAVEAAGPGGWVHVQLQSAECGMIIEVIDSGPGPAPEVAGRLFEPFVTGKPEGVGLGLAVARQVAEAHGGTIGWQRQADRTSFRIELPGKRPAGNEGQR